MCRLEGYCLDATFRHAQHRHPWRISWDKRAALRSTLAVHHRPTKLLYLTGYKNRNTFSDILGGAGVSPHSLEVYEACTRPWEAPLSLEIVAVRPHSI